MPREEAPSSSPILLGGGVSVPPPPSCEALAPPPSPSVVEGPAAVAASPFLGRNRTSGPLSRTVLYEPHEVHLMPARNKNSDLAISMQKLGVFFLGSNQGSVI